MIVMSLVLSFMFSQVVIPSVALGVDEVTGTGAQNIDIVTPGANQNVDVVTPGKAVTIKNPLKVNSIQEIIAEALKFVVNLLAIAGVLYIIWTGFLFVKAQGNPSELEKAKTSFLNAIIGMAIILGAWAIATAIANTINKVTNNNNVTLKP